MTIIEKLYEDEITCPYCSYEYSESYDFGMENNNDTTILECPNCENKFLAEIDITVSYSTKGLCKENNGEHNWKEFDHERTDGEGRLKGKSCLTCGETEFAESSEQGKSNDGDGRASTQSL